jgi:hypothetical protein
MLRGGSRFQGGRLLAWLMFSSETEMGVGVVV